MSKRVLVCLVATAALTACAAAPGRQPGEAIGPQAWADRVKVVEQPDEILLAIHADGPSPTQQAALEALSIRAMEAGADRLTIAIPAGLTASRFAAEASKVLARHGAQVVVDGYDGAGDPAAPLKASYLRAQAVTPRCGQEWESLTATRNNQPYANFGCAVNANLAAQIADPRDLTRPQTLAPADAGRRDTVMKAYRAGQITSTPADEQARAEVAKP